MDNIKYLGSITIKEIECNVCTLDNICTDCKELGKLCTLEIDDNGALNLIYIINNCASCNNCRRYGYINHKCKQCTKDIINIFNN